MKLKLLLLLLAVFTLNSCTVEDIEPMFDNTVIEEPIINDKGSIVATIIWIENFHDIHYNQNLSLIEINATRAYYFNKYHKRHISNRLSMYDEIPLESHHEVWLDLSFHIRPTPELNDPEGDLKDDPRINP